MAVDRCICHSIRFGEALAVARREACLSVAELQRHLPLGTGCGLCVAYMQCALATGQTDLPVFGEPDLSFWMERSGVVREGDA